ncbi:MAG: ATP-dependent RNA helicase HrpA [Neisseriaceae bacterium]|nr:ATP-dependent RNA helicase HrpA [Neisseriaceae bacterium]
MESLSFNLSNLNQVLCKDRNFLQKAIKNPMRFGGVAKINQRYHHSHKRYLQRLSSVTMPEYDGSLPVHEHIDEIKVAIQNNQVVIICGETGSGKTTQLPKICLELGRGVAGMIGHTQPRRLAARSVAERIADELHSSIGKAVGYKVRFNDKSGENIAIKLMTDGILLAETQTDRFLSEYDTIIIDEVHERSLNIDFLLGYLKNLLPKRPDLRVIITSATIDAKRISQHFNHAPIIEVSGRTYPVEIRYRPLNNLDEEEVEVDMPDAIVQAVDELASIGNGDILVFLPGEREIRETEQVLRSDKLRNQDEILPLFARLSSAQQQKIFDTNSHKRRIILSTNVAETSLTVPNIRYVVDTGLARIKRYSARAKVEQLHVEKISQASAKQRAGRCGRVANGVCIRLYDEDDFINRPQFSTPEIMRSNLAGVILRMKSLKLGDIENFPFLEVPDKRYINDGVQILQELWAIDDKGMLTDDGRQMARLPIDPCIAKILLASKKHDCIAELLIIVAALSVQDVRENHWEIREMADKAHERFIDKQSDFLTYLNIWDSFLHEKEKGLSNRQLNDWCRKHFLSHLRMREWRELYHQLSDIVVEIGLATKEELFRHTLTINNSLPENINNDATLSAQLKQKQLLKKDLRQQRRGRKAADYEAIHRALLCGLAVNIGMRLPENNDYMGSRGNHFHIFPASALFRGKQKWVIASELTDTARLYARNVAKIEPEWVEKEVPHLVRYHYFDPHWERKRGEVVAFERVTLYGLTVMPRRPVSYGKIAPQDAREIFIRSALVEQDADIRAGFFNHNRKMIDEIAQLEHKSRRPDVLVDDEVLFSFYNQRIPQIGELSGRLNDIVDLPSFEQWRIDAEKQDSKLLYLNRDDLMRHTALHITEEQFPNTLNTKDGKLKLTYRFEPHHIMDGVTATIPLPLLNRISPERLEWLVPGMIREKLQLLIKALPKQIRRLCVPVPEFITQFLSNKIDMEQAIIPQLSHAIAKTAGDMRILDEIDQVKWAECVLPQHCYFNIRVIDDGGQELSMGRDILALREKLGHIASVTFRDSGGEFEKENITTWNIGSLPENLKFARGKQQLTGYLGLLKEKDGSISLRLFDTNYEAMHSHRVGTIALMALQLKEQIKDLNRGLMNFNQLAMLLKHIPADYLRESITHAICDRAFIADDDLPRDEKSFKEQIKKARTRLPSVKEAMNIYLQEIANVYAELNNRLLSGKHPLNNIIREKIAILLNKDFATQTPWHIWQRLPIYIKAMIVRLDKYGNNPSRDMAREQDIKYWEQQLSDKCSYYYQQQQIPSGRLLEFRWKIEELRVSLFAQELKTPYLISLKRLEKEWIEINKNQ